VLLAGPAFAVGARRRRRQLALIAANGGTPAHIRRIVLGDGVVLGLAGAVAGIIVGVVAAFAARPYVETHLMHVRAGGYRVFPLALVAIGVLAVAAGVLAALVPAFVTARQDVVAALAGRRGITRSRKRWLLLGLGMVATGTAVVMAATRWIDAETILIGLIVGELGIVLCTPSIVGLIARAGRVLPLAPRIALRDAARNRAAAAPAIAAVMAAVAGSVALGLYLDSSRTYEREHYTGNLAVGAVEVNLGENAPAVIESAVRSVVPVDEVFQVSDMVCAGTGTADPSRCYLYTLIAPGLECPYLSIVESGERPLSADERRRARADDRCDPDVMYGRGQAQVDDGRALAVLTGASGEDLERARATLRAGGIVVRQANLIHDGTVTVAVVDAREATTGSADPTLTAPRMDFPGYLLTTGNGPGGSIISPGAVAKAGLGTAVTSLVASTTRMPTQAEADSLAAVLQPLHGYGYVEQGPARDTDARLWLLTAAAVAITIGAAAVGTGLAAADGRADLSTLAAVGASPRMRRGLSVSQSGVIALLGSGLGVLAGLGTAIAVISALNQRYADMWPGPGALPIVVPWLTLGIALVGAPAVAIAGAGLLTRSRLPIERRL